MTNDKKTNNKTTKTENVYELDESGKVIIPITIEKNELTFSLKVNRVVILKLSGVHTIYNYFRFILSVGRQSMQRRKHALANSLQLILI